MEVAVHPAGPAGCRSATRTSFARTHGSAARAPARDHLGGIPNDVVSEELTPRWSQSSRHHECRLQRAQRARANWTLGPARWDGGIGGRMALLPLHIPATMVV